MPRRRQIVFESLEFSANLHVPKSASKHQRFEMVKLQDIRITLYGMLSIEKNKFTALGVELETNPSIVFCDEPTLGPAPRRGGRS
jgi:ABC-type multidrug transport system ATPase subunit